MMGKKKKKKKKERTCRNLEGPDRAKRQTVRLTGAGAAIMGASTISFS